MRECKSCIQHLIHSTVPALSAKVQRSSSCNSRTEVLHHVAGGRRKEQGQSFRACHRIGAWWRAACLVQIESNQLLQLTWKPLRAQLSDVHNLIARSCQQLADCSQSCCASFLVRKKSYAHARARTHTHTDAYIHIYTHTYIYIYTHAYVNICVYTYKHTWTFPPWLTLHNMH